MNEVSIEGLDHAELLAALHKGSRSMGMSILHERPVSVEECREFIDRIRPLNTNLAFDYFAGRVIKCELAGPTMRTALYDRDNGQGACAAVVRALRGKS